ncbi:O-succinylbenzoic acid--CoA ligase [Salinibacterium amurskyense]|uniref:O-succinylbenzoic acid--CoA ligase n=1 Tax=Salinibacterium amurskyense TaxID=205941 RepID=A0A2M9D2V2_9MICO|nr:AMP-binding protein [Salinibacterium amurskyense]PJJ78338.1 O-succinylbenzoic acid--CoA ligase [Salinibacterium amurskyense]RLQ80447.1 o-succinylbenzoate--CoA ligase [Salinibacterium amurskyense]GHD83425.1 O-succinylbenzoic acid--CoA ligase [Salinibacterium amurskyense]
MTAENTPTRELWSVDARDPRKVWAALKPALDGSGAAILPHPTSPSGLPETVPANVAVIVETSGSTGRPKRVMLSAAALKASAAASDELLGGPGQWLLAVPAHYIAGINVMARSYFAGTEPALMPPKGFTAETFVAAAAELTAERRFVSLVPVQLSRLLESDEAVAALSRFTRILVGGQSTPIALLAAARARGLAVSTTYGSSETSGGAVWDGKPLPGVGLRLVDDRIELSGPMLAEGYLDDPRRSAFSFRLHEGVRWYRTDDVGEVVDGVLRVRGRADDMIISGGVKVSLAEVETAVRALPGQSAAVVVAAPHPEWGEAPVVITTTAIELDVLRQSVAAQLSSTAAAPARVILIDEIPMLSTGKPDKLALASVVLK